MNVSETMSKSCQVRMYVVPAMPAEAKARLMRMAAGQHKMAHGETTYPSAGHDEQKGAQVDRAAQDAPAQIAQRDITDARAGSTASRRRSWRS